MIKKYVGKSRLENLDWLLKVWLKEGPPVCFLQGFSGVGKSDLARDFRELAEKQTEPEGKLCWKHAVIEEIADRVTPGSAPFPATPDDSASPVAGAPNAPDRPSPPAVTPAPSTDAYVSYASFQTGRPGRQGRVLHHRQGRTPSGQGGPIGPGEAGTAQRLGFMAGEIAIPDDFDRMGETEMAQLFGSEQP